MTSRKIIASMGCDPLTCCGHSSARRHSHRCQGVAKQGKPCPVSIMRTGRKHGGWRGHPNSIAALANHRILFADKPRCEAIAHGTKQQCRKAACHGRTRCATHSGNSKTAARTARQALRRSVRWLETHGLVPERLAQHPAWQRAHWGPCRHDVLLRMLAGWANQDHEGFASAVRDAWL